MTCAFSPFSSVMDWLWNGLPFSLKWKEKIIDHLAAGFKTPVERLWITFLRCGNMILVEPNSTQSEESFRLCLRMFEDSHMVQINFLNHWALSCWPNQFNLIWQVLWIISTDWSKNVTKKNVSFINWTSLLKISKSLHQFDWVGSYKCTKRWFWRRWWFKSGARRTV